MAAPKFPTATPFLPSRPTLLTLRDAAQTCRGCDLYRAATQAVVGEGPARARIVMVGEQPGDKEDRAGAPFVGPAGAILDQALEAAAIPRAEIYLNKTVKHFKFEERGKRRIHKKPTEPEIVACYPWLQTELELIKPALIVCLGATAARAVLGKKHRLLAQRGQFFAHPLAPAATATIHPSVILRAASPEEREAAFASFVEDLRNARRHLGHKSL